MEVPSMRPWMNRSLTAVVVAGVLALPGGVAAAATATDVQANRPQVSGDPTSDTTAVFPTKKQNEPTIAVNPLTSQYLIAGANDKQRQPPCGPGLARGPATASHGPFFPGLVPSGTSRSI